MKLSPNNKRRMKAASRDGFALIYVNIVEFLYLYIKMYNNLIFNSIYRDENCIFFIFCLKSRGILLYRHKLEQIHFYIKVSLF